MKTNVNICTEEWCNLVFEGKNKEYGAFAIRTHATQQKTKSLLITLFLATSIAVLPLLKEKIVPFTTYQGTDAPTIITQITVDPPKPLQIDPPKAPAPMRPMIKFAALVIGNTETQEDLPINDALINRNISIGPENKPGDETADYTDYFDNGNGAGFDKNKIFTTVEKPPHYKGGYEELVNFLRNNLRYPEAARDNNIFGRVYVQFVVDKNGDIQNIKILRGLDDSCNEEAIRVLKIMPKWDAGMQNGMLVSVYYTLPIVFSMQQ